MRWITTGTTAISSSLAQARRRDPMMTSYFAGLAGPDDERFQDALLTYGVAELGYVAHLFAGVNGGREETVGGNLSCLEASRRGGDHG